MKTEKGQRVKGSEGLRTDGRESAEASRSREVEENLLHSPLTTHHSPSHDQSDYLVPDVLRPGLTLVLVGTAPSRISAARRAYYANPTNKFWRTLHEVGLTPRQLSPQEYPLLPTFGIGLTDVAKRHSGVDAALPAEAWRPAELLEKLRLYRPQLVAFTSKRGASETLGVPTGKLPYGPQEHELEGVPVWVLPSTSPLGHSYFQLEPWQNLAREVERLQRREQEP